MTGHGQFAAASKGEPVHCSDDRLGRTFDLGKEGLARLRSRRTRAQGELMLAMAALRRGDADVAGEGHHVGAFQNDRTDGRCMPMTK